MKVNRYYLPLESNKAYNYTPYVIIILVSKDVDRILPKDVFAGMATNSSFINNVHKLTIEELIELYAYAEAIVETVREPLLVLDKNFYIKTANKGFF
jgi:hypothetical protein